MSIEISTHEAVKLIALSSIEIGPDDHRSLVEIATSIGNISINNGNFGSLNAEVKHPRPSMNDDSYNTK